MNRKQFYKQLKQIYYQTKRGIYDSSFEDISRSFIRDIEGKSNGGWDESIAEETMRSAEHIFRIQPEATQQAKTVTPSDAESALKEFLVERNYNYTHIPESDKQTPDGHIEGHGHKYICEIKSPLLMFDHKAAPFGYKHTTTHRKILDAIHTAKKQLEKLDPEYSLPHILIYTSAHSQLNHTNFIDTIRGYTALRNGDIMTDLRGTDIFKTTEPILDDIDLYIWFQVNSSKQFNQVSYFNNQHSPHAGSIDKFVDQLKSISLSSIDNHASCQFVTGKENTSNHGLSI